MYIFNHEFFVKYHGYCYTIVVFLWNIMSLKKKAAKLDFWQTLAHFAKGKPY
jgi:hypothetical protein